MYTIKSFNDETTEFVIDHRGYIITIDYPADVETFSELSEDDINLLVSGYIASHKDMPDFVEPEQIQQTSTPVEWF